MKVTDFTRQVLLYRKQERSMYAKGYRKLNEIDWELTRGGKQDMRVTDIVLGVDGNSLYYKVGK